MKAIQQYYCMPDENEFVGYFQCISLKYPGILFILFRNKLPVMKLLIFIMAT